MKRTIKQAVMQSLIAEAKSARLSVEHIAEVALSVTHAVDSVSSEAVRLYLLVNPDDRFYKYNSWDERRTERVKSLHARARKALEEVSKRKGHKPNLS